MAMDNLFDSGLAAFPSNWSSPDQAGEEIYLGCYVEIGGGSYAELCGVVTYLERVYAWVRLDGDGYDLRFRRELLRRLR